MMIFAHVKFNLGSSILNKLNMSKIEEEVNFLNHQILELAKLRSNLMHEMTKLSKNGMMNQSGSLIKEKIIYSKIALKCLQKLIVNIAQLIKAKQEMRHFVNFQLQLTESFNSTPAYPLKYILEQYIEAMEELEHDLKLISLEEIKKFKLSVSKLIELEN